MIFVGDIHGDYEILYHSHHGLSNELLIQVGDFGIGFKSLEMDLEKLGFLINDLEKHNNTLYVIHGNHDNPAFWRDDLKECINNISPNLRFVSDYEIIEIEDKKILFIGGADSIDKAYRIEGVSWWADECVQPGDINQSIDWVISHTAPNFCFPFFSNDTNEAKKERSYLTNVFEKWTPSLWIYGHFHLSKTETINDCMFKLLNINEFYESGN